MAMPLSPLHSAHMGSFVSCWGRPTLRGSDWLCLGHGLGMVSLMCSKRENQPLRGPDSPLLLKWPLICVCSFNR